LNDGLTFFLVAIVFVVGFLVVATPIVFFVNRAIGATYDQRAAGLAPHLHAETVRFAEDDVRIRGTWIAPFGVSVRWSRADVRITTRAIYLLQHARMFGRRIGKPIVAFPIRGAQLDPWVAANVTLGVLESIRADDAAHLVGTFVLQRFSMRLAVRDVTGFAQAVA
jgi:hypothetical protein